MTYTVANRRLDTGQKRKGKRTNQNVEKKATNKLKINDSSQRGNNNKDKDKIQNSLHFKI